MIPEAGQVWEWRGPNRVYRATLLYPSEDRWMLRSEEAGWAFPSTLLLDGTTARNDVDGIWRFVPRPCVCGAGEIADPDGYACPECLKEILT